MSKFFTITAPDPPNLNPNSCLGAFGTVSLLTELRCKMGRTGAINALVRATKSRRNFSQLTHPIHLIGPQINVLWHFRPFRYCKNFGAKWAELVQLIHKFVQQSHVGIFHNERTRSTSLYPKLMFWFISDCFITARTLVQNGPNCCN
jgi:hypothetical protein